MAVRIRLSRVGKPKHPSYRIVAADSRRSRDGRYLEVLGTYHPRRTDKQVVWKADRMQHWLSKGAIPTQTVGQLLKREPLAQS